MPPHRPAFDDFARRAGDARFVPVYRQLVGDALTPVSAFRRIERPGPSFLFESVIGGEKVGRYSFLGTEPFLRFEARGKQVTITPTARPESSRTFEQRRPVPRPRIAPVRVHGDRPPRSPPLHRRGRRLRGV